MKLDTDSMNATNSALKRDREIIKKITAGRNLDDKEDLLAVYSFIQSHHIYFETDEGRAFDDDIYKRVCELKKGGTKSIPSKTVEPALSVTDEDVLKELRKMEKRRKLIGRFSLLLAITFITVFAVIYHNDSKTDKEAMKLAAIKDTTPINRDLPQFKVSLNIKDASEPVVLEVLDKYKNLYNLNQSLIGWLKIDDTIIDYPVMQTVDNTYYLTHNFEQEEDKKGCLFLDYRNSITGFSDNMIIYGHHLRSGKMFGNLPDYEDEVFFEEHRYVQFDTLYEERTYAVMYVFRSPIYKETDIRFKYYNFLDASSEAEFDSYMNEMKEMSLYDTGVTASYGEELLTLSTCDNISSKERFVVVCKRIR